MITSPYSTSGSPQSSGKRFVHNSRFAVSLHFQAYSCALIPSVSGAQIKGPL